ncbi:S8 family serine peptidase [Desulfosporosinus sp. BG]|uniref:S8 family serine peptidase n=1 Tax=Desulfosporosinus sp. BG TaxID=1633135 RepID=UPI0008574F4D|nr:S8 family serine peptidase [Desulfosporosinus sp. BG]ODA41183.1 Protease [Desulfosporosinus sp. BG]
MIFLNLGLAPLPSTEQLNLTQEKTSQSVVPLQVVISLAPGVDLGKLAQDFGAEVVRRGPLNYATLKLKETTNMPQVIAELKKTPGILGAEENYRRTTQSLASSTVPTDPLFKDQWSMVSGDVQGAWDMGATGQGVTIAVIDTGVALNHPDLKDNLVPGYNAITQSEAQVSIQDNNGHGTHVAGIAAAEKNDVGIVGVAYQAKIMPIKVMNSTGEGNDDVIADGIVWAADHGAKILNLSFGSEDGSDSSDILRSAVAYAYNKGCLMVAAAGNYDSQAEGNPGVSYPASDPDVLAVAATNKTNNAADYSVAGPEVDLTAPGDSIPSDWWSKTQGAGYAEASGTSMAAPFVAGEAALVWSQHPDWSRDQVIQVLEAGVKDLGSPGIDNNYGYGLVDVKLALSLSNQTLDKLTSPASVNGLGGIVQATAGSTQLALTIPAQAIAKSANVSLNTITAPASLPNGASFITPVVQIDWGSETPQKILSLKLNDSSLKVDSEATIYHWDGSRWIALGGEIANGEASLGLYRSGIYTVGTSPATTESNRFAGATAEETAVEISKATFTTGADTVILAQANQFPDALAGAPLAYKLQAPILLSPSSGLTEDVRAELQRLAPKTIYLLGGTAALSSTIETELRQKYAVKRLSGYTAEGTAAAIALELGTEGKAVVASVRSFRDSLVISAWAARQGVPILLTESSTLSGETLTVLRELNVTQTLVIGGTAVVGANVMDRLPLPKRISGYTAYDTAAAVLEEYPPTTAKLEIATGENYPDALTGAVRAALYGSMVIIVPTNSATPASLTTLLKSWQGRQVEAFGGVVALPEKVLETVQSWVL